MRILMINSNRYKMIIPAMPFGMCYVAAAIEKAGHGVKVLDLCFSKNCSRDIMKALDEFVPDIVGVSIRNIDCIAANLEKNIYLLDDVRDAVINPLKKLFRGPIVIGGSAVGIAGVEMLSFLNLDYAIRGDGEEAMVEFIHRIENKIPLKGLGGLIQRKGNKIIENNPALRVSDLDSLAHARQYHYIDIKPYLPFKSPIQIQTKRGCPNKCSYCTYKNIEGNRFRLRDPQLVADEVEEVVKNSGAKHIEFTDNTFNIPLDHAKAVLRAIAAKRLDDVTFCTLGINPKLMDEELAGLMKECNFSEVDVGADSGSDAMLERLGKNYTKEAIIRCGRILHDANIPIRWFYVLGGPGETNHMLAETFDTINRSASELDLVGLGLGYRLYNGTSMATEYLSANPGCTKDNFLHPVEYSPAAFDNTPGALSLEAVYNIVLRETFKNPNYFIFEDNQHIPPIAIKIQATLMKLLAPKHPVWRSIIFINRLQKSLGIFHIKAKLLDRKVEKFEIMPPIEQYAHNAQ